MAIFTNQATLRYNDVVTNSNVATGELLEVLSATKTAVQDTYRVGDDVTLTIDSRLCTEITRSFSRYSLSAGKIKILPPVFEK